MIESVSLPEVMLMEIGTEPRDFAVKSTHAKHPRKSLGTMFFGLLWLGFIIFFIILALGPLFSGQEIHFSSNGKAETAGPGNLKPALPIIIFFGIFVIIGFLLFISGIINLVKSGGYFAGTPSRLVYFRKGVMKSISWDQFTGNIEVRGNPRKGSLTLEMCTGTIGRRRGYIPDIVYISGIPSVYEVEQFCRKRISEKTKT